MGSGLTDTTSKLTLHVSSGLRLAEVCKRRLGGVGMDRSPERFAELAREHREAMFRVARRVLADNDAATDAVQDAFVKAWGAWQKLEHDADLRSWLLRIVERSALDLLRSRRPKVELDERLMPVDQPLVSVECRMLLKEAISRLPSVQRQIVYLTSEDHSIEEMAEMLGMKKEAVKKALYRARQELRTSLNQEDLK